MKGIHVIEPEKDTPEKLTILETPGFNVPHETIQPDYDVIDDEADKYNDPTWFTIKDVMEHTGLSESTIRRKIRDGSLKGTLARGPQGVNQYYFQEKDVLEAFGDLIQEGQAVDNFKEEIVKRLTKLENNNEAFLQTINQSLNIALKETVNPLLQQIESLQTQLNRYDSKQIESSQKLLEEMKVVKENTEWAKVNLQVKDEQKEKRGFLARVFGK